LDDEKKKTWRGKKLHVYMRNSKFAKIAGLVC